jgi:ParB family chromosome partitioning protein
MDLQHIPLSNLKIANVNVRHSRKPPDVSDILPSIRARGVLQPLLVRPNGRGFEIVAGRRRYFAASKVAEEQGVAATEVLLPCAVTEQGDDAGAMEASLIENVARAPMDELEEFEAFAKLLKQGRRPADIALTFGVTELYVKQRFALANLQSGSRTPTGTAISSPRTCNSSPPLPAVSKRNGSLPLSRKATLKTRRRKARRAATG